MNRNRGNGYARCASNPQLLMRTDALLNYLIGRDIRTVFFAVFFTKFIHKRHSSKTAFRKTRNTLSTLMLMIYNTFVGCGQRKPIKYGQVNRWYLKWRRITAVGCMQIYDNSVCTLVHEWVTVWYWSLFWLDQRTAERKFLYFWGHRQRATSRKSVENDWFRQSGGHISMTAIDSNVFVRAASCVAEVGSECVIISVPANQLICSRRRRMIMSISFDQYIFMFIYIHTDICSVYENWWLAGSSSTSSSSSSRSFGILTIYEFQWSAVREYANIISNFPPMRRDSFDRYADTVRGQVVDGDFFRLRASTEKKNKTSAYWFSVDFEIIMTTFGSCGR